MENRFCVHGLSRLCMLTLAIKTLGTPLSSHNISQISELCGNALNCCSTIVSECGNIETNAQRKVFAIAPISPKQNDFFYVLAEKHSDETKNNHHRHQNDDSI